MSKKDPSADASQTHRTSDLTPGTPLARKRRRARLTTAPMAVRASGNSRRGLRLRDLFEAFMADHDPNDVVVQAAALRCAELTATSEDIRAEMRDDSTNPDGKPKLSAADQLKLAETLVRVENLATRAQKQLEVLLQQRKSEGLSWDELQRQAAELRAAEDAAEKDDDL